MNINDVKKLREETGAGVMDARQALEDASGNYQKAKEILKSKGLEKAAKKSEREIKAGRIFSYIHAGGSVGVIVKLGCETDFVAKNDEFSRLGSEIAMQVAAMDPQSVDELLEQAYIREPQKTIKDLLSEVIAKTGENITLAEFKRLRVG